MFLNWYLSVSEFVCMSVYLCVSEFECLCIRDCFLLNQSDLRVSELVFMCFCICVFLCFCIFVSVHLYSQDCCLLNQSDFTDKKDCGSRQRP